MKKFISLCLCFCLCLTLCACGSKQAQEAEPTPIVVNSSWSELPEKGDFLYEAMSSDHMHLISSELPSAVDIRIDSGWEGETVHISDAETIQKIVDAFTKVTVGDETNEIATDNSAFLTFIFSDGQKCSLCFNQKNLEIGINNSVHLYLLDNFDDLWKLIRSVYG